MEQQNEEIDDDGMPMTCRECGEHFNAFDCPDWDDLQCPACDSRSVAAD